MEPEFQDISSQTFLESSMFIKSIPALKNKLFAPSLRMVICIPSGITSNNRLNIYKGANGCGTQDYYIIPKVYIGTGLNWTFAPMIDVSRDAWKAPT